MTPWDRLARERHHVREAEARVAQQEAIVAKMEKFGWENVELAKMILESYRVTLRLTLDHLHRLETKYR